MSTTQPVHEAVQEYYGRLLQSTSDLKTTAASCCRRAPHRIISDVIAKIPLEVKDKFYGCGNPIPLGIEGKRVLDLGSGSGRDCYIAAALVGETGEVTGVDMTDEQLQVARANVPAFAKSLGYTPNISFVKGYIEALQAAGIKKEAVDICISNCVINLSPDKKKVLEGVFEALVDGGEMYFADVYASSRLPDSVRRHPVLFGECIGGALYTEDFVAIAKEIGFAAPLELQSHVVQIQDPELRELVGDTTFRSITYRLFKIPSSYEKGHRVVSQEQLATYNGGIKGQENEYTLDKEYIFSAGKPKSVSDSVANILSYSWLQPHFNVHSIGA